jgi:hypothetical protein
MNNTAGAKASIGDRLSSNWLCSRALSKQILDPQRTLIDNGDNPADGAKSPD